MEEPPSRLRQLLAEVDARHRLRRDVTIMRQGIYAPIESREDLLAALGKPVSAELSMKTAEYTASESEQVRDANETNLYTEPSLATEFPGYQNWRAEGGLKGNVSDRVLVYEAGRFENYMKGTPLFATPVSQLDDVQAVAFLHQLRVSEAPYTPRKECAKTLSQMASYLRATGKRRGPLLFQKLSVSKSDTEKKEDGPQAKRLKFYHPGKEMPDIFHAARSDQEQFDAVATLYFGAFRKCDGAGFRCGASTAISERSTK